MRFDICCDDRDGIVIIDKAYLDELNDELLYEFDILLDPKGESELVYDFDDKWEDVWNNKTQGIRDFCNKGKLCLWLLNQLNEEWSMVEDENLQISRRGIDVTSGHIIVVLASELVQCLMYPELEMETLAELELKKGWYNLSKEGRVIRYSSTTEKKQMIINVSLDN